MIEQPHLMKFTSMGISNLKIRNKMIQFIYQIIYNMLTQKLPKPLVMALLLIFSFSMQAQSYQDCISTFPVCEMKTYHIGEMRGKGQVADLLKDLRCSSQMQETNSFWFSWDVIEEGTMTFVINPIDQKDDIDFVLFKRKKGSCAQLEEVRCMASGRTHGADELQSNSPCEGNTGLSIQSRDDFERAGCKYNDDNYLKFLKASEGEEYVLMVNNFNSANGFSITFEGDCDLEMVSNCSRFDINEPVLITELYPNPTNQQINIEFMSDSDETATLHIYSVSGELIKESEMNVNRGINTSSIQVEDLDSGSYVIKLTQGAFTTNKQFIKQ